MELIEYYRLSKECIYALSFLHSGYRAIEITILRHNSSAYMHIESPDSLTGTASILQYSGGISYKLLDVSDYVKHNDVQYPLDSFFPEKTATPISNIYFARYYVFARDFYMFKMNNKLIKEFKNSKKKIFI